MYRSTSKDEQIKVNEGYREEQKNTAEKSQQKERENPNTKGDNVTSSTKEEIQNLKKDLKYSKETLKAITFQQWLANREEANDNIKGIKKQKKKEPKDNNTQSNKHKETVIEEKAELTITRNENNKRKDINENRENTKNKIN